MAETGWKCGRRNSGGRIGLHARLGSGALFLADPMGPPPSVIRGRGNSPQGTPGPRGLSRGSTYRQSAGLPAWLMAPGCDYTRLSRMEGTLFRLEERNHVSIMGPGGGNTWDLEYRRRRGVVPGVGTKGIFPVQWELIVPFQCEWTT